MGIAVGAPIKTAMEKGCSYFPFPEKKPTQLMVAPFQWEDDMDTTTLLIIIVVLLLLGGGWYGRGRWY